jgi:hypothetical protein
MRGGHFCIVIVIVTRGTHSLQPSQPGKDLLEGSKGS